MGWGDFGADRAVPAHLPLVTPAEVETAARMYRRAVVCWAASYVGEQAAEDVAQAALEALVRRGPDVEARAAPSWLRTTVHHLARAHARSRREVPVAELPDAASLALGPEDTLRSAQIGSAVRQALAQMPAARRTLVASVLAEGRSIAEVAREEGIPESTARARVHDGAEELRGVLVRERAAERRRSGGFSSWAVVWAVIDWTRRKSVRAACALGATAAAIAGGALLHIPDLTPTADEMPARVAVVEPVPWPVSEARAATGVERAAPVVVAPPRARHDAGARFRAERFGR